MKYLFKWLKQLVDIDATPEELAEELSLKSVEIDEITGFGGDFLDTVVVGVIKEIEKHPNADKLQVTKTDVGSEVLQIVCGAPNIAVGQKVPVALVGTKLPGGEIKEAKIRDVESFGMLCAEDELQLGNDHSGILILDSSLPVGTKLSKIYSDTVLEGKPAANRGDLLNHVGLARELSAIYDVKLMSGVETQNFASLQVGDSESVSVEIENLEACSLYTARLIKGVKIGPSPIWMQQALLACGMKPINNVVDVTNFVMLEYGNPLHAFDAKKIPIADGKHKIVVRLTKSGEIIRTLDGKDHEIPEGLLVIADGNPPAGGPVAVAGVMGGENSEIDETTVDIILESANFSSKFIRKSQQELGISTEASARFAKGLSRELALMGLERATQLFEEVCGGKAVEIPVVAGNLPEVKKAIEIDFEKINAFLSIDIKADEAVKILQNLGFIVESNKVTAPSFREDIEIWQDVAEEIGRIYGLDKVHEEELTTKIDPKTSKELYFEQSARKYLSQELGLTEVVTMSILSSDLVEKTMMKDNFFEIINPLNEYDTIMRGGLWSGLLKHTAENGKKFEKFSFFDLSKVYLESGHPMSGLSGNPDIGCPDELPSKEKRVLAILIYGEKDDEGLFVAKNYLDKFAEKFGFKFEYENDYSADAPYKHPGRSAIITNKGKRVGRVVEIHPVVLENLDIKKRAWIGAVNIEALVDEAKNVAAKFAETESNVIFKEFSRFEVSKRDIAVIVDENLEASEISKTIREIDDKIIGAELFDEFKSEKFGAGKKSVAFHLVFQATDHTLTDQEVDGLFEKALTALNTKYNAELRK
ncbi:MAG: phenylalanine--tRNA ligase subunit beta [Patescibacteria group bacterium]|nr:phenylalanine--tRNA ligase subunit beta [Patescibacteria group bacterium]